MAGTTARKSTKRLSNKAQKTVFFALFTGSLQTVVQGISIVPETSPRLSFHHEKLQVLLHL